MTNIDVSNYSNALKLRSDVIERIIPVIENRFESYRENEIFNATTWLDPQYWTDDKNNGKDQIIKLMQEFSEPLKAAGIEKEKVLKEWKSFQITVKNLYKGQNLKTLWKNVFQFKRKEFPNLTILAELAICFSSSNATVERGFSVLTTILSNRRLSMKHSTMEDCVIIAANQAVWSKEEENEIITNATKNYMKKRRIGKITTATGKTAAAMQSRYESSSDEGSSSRSSESETDESSSDNESLVSL